MRNRLQQLKKIDTISRYRRFLLLMELNAWKFLLFPLSLFNSRFRYFHPLIVSVCVCVLLVYHMHNSLSFENFLCFVLFTSDKDFIYRINKRYRIKVKIYLFTSDNRHLLLLRAYINFIFFRDTFSRTGLLSM